jgi:PAS domain S-box-containing protein
MHSVFSAALPLLIDSITTAARQHETSPELGQELLEALLDNLPAVGGAAIYRQEGESAVRLVVAGVGLQEFAETFELNTYPALRKAFRTAVPGQLPVSDGFAGVYPFVVSERALYVLLIRPADGETIPDDLHRLLPVVTNLIALALGRINPQSEANPSVQIRQSEAELQALFNAMNDVVIVYDRDGRYVRIAPTNPDLLLGPPGGLVGKQLHDVLPRETADLLLEAIHDALDSQENRRLEYCLDVEDQARWFLATVSPMPGDQVMFVARDITESRMMLSHVEETLKHRSRQMQTVTDVAQEIAAAQGLTEMLSRVVTLVKERFGYYHVQIFRADVEARALRLAAAYGGKGERLLAANLCIPMAQGVVGTAFVAGKSVLASDVTQNSDWLFHEDLPETRGELAVPIILRGDVLGILDVHSAEAGLLDAEDQLLIENLCDQISIAMEGARHIEAAQAQAFREQRLNEIVVRLQECADIDSLMNTALRELGMTLGARVGRIRLTNVAEAPITIPETFTQEI